jgi:RNA polymerase primary sigma factor
MSLDANDPLKFYLRELGTIRPLTKDEETDLLRHVRAHDEMAESAARRLIEANLSLVVPIAERHLSEGIQMLDLIQYGNKGLLFAIETLAESSGDSFSAHAATCIEGAVLRAISESK